MESYLPRCTIGSRQAEHESRRVDGREDDMVKSTAIASYGDESMKMEGGVDRKIKNKKSIY